MDRYKTVRIEVLGRTASFSAPGRGGETEVFLTELREEIARCREKQAKGIWMTLPLSGFYLAPTCRLEGFTLHHIQDDRLVLSLSLLKDSANTMPKYLSHTVGVAGCVINKKTAQVLVIRDTTRPNIWKLPGGFSEPGENIQQTAQREILEETGIDSEFQSVLAFRQHHKMPSSFGMSDIYVVCRMEPRSLEMKPCPVEVLECRWRSVTEMLSNQETHPLMRRVLLTVSYGLAHGFNNVDIQAETCDSIWPGMTYQLFSRNVSLPSCTYYIKKG